MGNKRLQKVRANQSLTFLALCTSAPPHWVKQLWSPPVCLSCFPSCSQGSDQKLQMSLQVTWAHFEFYLLQKVDLVEGEHELSFFSLRKKDKKKINNFFQENPHMLLRNICSFGHSLRLFKKVPLMQIIFFFIINFFSGVALLFLPPL